MNRRFGDILKTDADEGKEKHVPVIRAARDDKGTLSIEVIVGAETPHPNTSEHHIKWVQLFAAAAGKNPVHIATLDLGPAHGEPRATLTVQLDLPCTVYAVSYCNLHGLWESSLELS